MDIADDPRHIHGFGVAPAARPLFRCALLVDAGQAVEESADIVPAPQFAVGDDVEAGFLLVANGLAHGFVLCRAQRVT